MNEINRNFSECDEYSVESFIGILHGKYEWNDDEYFRLEDYLYLIGQGGPSGFLSRDIAWPVMKIYSYLCNLIGCHLDSNDSFSIAGMDLDSLYSRRERAQLVFEGFFKGDMPDTDLLRY